MIIVYAYVCADIIHSGHLLQLQNAKAMGDKLIVGVLTDEAVMEKKPRPVIPFVERLRIVQALKCVDMAVPQDKYSPVKNILALNPDVHFDSLDHINNDYIKELRKKFTGRIIFTPYYPDVSSSKIKEECVKRWKKQK